MTKNEAVVKQFKEAAIRLKEALSAPKNEIVRDSAIKRFEMCFDLAWKSVKDYVREEGVECHNPKTCFEAGFQSGLIEIANEEQWSKMVGSRNLTVHTYNEELADEVYSLLSEYLVLFEKLVPKLEKGYGTRRQS